MAGRNIPNYIDLIIGQLVDLYLNFKESQGSLSYKLNQISYADPSPRHITDKQHADGGLRKSS